MEVPNAAQEFDVDTTLKEWRQGDCVLGEQWFAYRLDVDHPLTEAASDAAEEGIDLAESEVLGFMVLTQTCDIVRTASNRPFIEVAPLVEVEEHFLHDIKKGRRPNYAYVAALADQSLVADIDRVMTVEKAVVARWERVQGCLTQADERQLSLALARKRARWAFPDDFSELAKPLTNRMKSKHDKNTDEGQALRSLREIRVRAIPSWEADEAELFFWFIRDGSDDEPANVDWDDLCQKWIGLVESSGRFESISGLPVFLEDITAKDYVESDLLDLDHLSTTGG